jgi:hypothetical protein
MLTEAQARTAALAGLNKIKNARSGRVHSEALMRPDAHLHQASFELTSISDAVFNLDQPATMVVLEVSNNIVLAAEEKTGSSHEINETRSFPSEGLTYQRLILGVSRTDDTGSIAESTDVVFDNTDEAEPVRWTVLTREVLGLKTQDPGPALNIFAYPELEVLLADPGQKAVVSHNDTGQTLLDLPVKAGQIAAFLKMLQIIEYPGGMSFTVRLVIGTQGLDCLSLIVPYSALDSYLDLIDSVVVRFWRMGEAITIKKPDPEECFPPVSPVSTVIEACDLESSERYISFELDGRQCTDHLYWRPDSDRSYVPLAAGDKLRITGSRRPFFKDKQNKAITFNLWAAWRADDGQLIQDFRKDESRGDSPRVVAYYQRITDVIDQVVTLTNVQVIEEPVRVQFEDALVGELDSDDYLVVDRSVLATAGVEVGTAVTLHGRNTPLGTLIYRMELADGRSIL